MRYIRIQEEDTPELYTLHSAYKREILENAPTAENLSALRRAIQGERILFYGCREGDRLIACCSISLMFSTFDYEQGGLFEDFYILPAYRHRGIAWQLISFALQQSGCSTLLVCCADCDLEMYRALGFRTRIGNTLGFVK